MSQQEKGMTGKVISEDDKYTDLQVGVNADLDQELKRNFMVVPVVVIDNNANMVFDVDTKVDGSTKNASGEEVDVFLANETSKAMGLVVKGEESEALANIIKRI
ncbi:hypothetical protein AgCh_032552 [Apium graveolens]